MVILKVFILLMAAGLVTFVPFPYELGDTILLFSASPFHSSLPGYVTYS